MERPILFSGPMVRAILDGKKTQTRRALKPQPPTPETVKSMSGDTYHWFTDMHSKSPAHFRVAGAVWAVRKLGYPTEIKCPYGAPGDRLWVREAWGVSDGVNESLLHTCGIFFGADGPDGWTSYVDVPFDYAYEKMLKLKTSEKLRPSIHMPRWASRIDLEITTVRVERLNDISEADAIAEGVMAGYGRLTPDDKISAIWTARQRYAALWNKINGEGSYRANPYVWVIEFTRIP